jgi:Tfp pilus assembly protein PilO
VPKTKPTSAASKTLEKRSLSANNYILAMAFLTMIMVVVTGYVAIILGKEAFLQTKLIAHKYGAQEKYETKVKNATTLIQKYQQLGSTRDLIEHALPNTPDFPQVVSLIEFAGKSAGVKIVSISPDASGATASDTQATEIKAQPQKVTFGVELEGSYAKMVAFLENLEYSARPMKVIVATFKGSDSTLKVSLEIETAYQVKSSVEDPLKELK